MFILISLYIIVIPYDYSIRIGQILYLAYTYIDNKSFLNRINSGVVNDPDFFNFISFSKIWLLPLGLGTGTFTGFNSEPRAFCNFIFVNNGIRIGFINFVSLGNLGGKIGNKGNFGGRIGKIGSNGNLGIRGNNGNLNFGNLGNFGNLPNFLERIADFTRDFIFAFTNGFVEDSLLESRGIDLGNFRAPGFMFIVIGA